MSKSHILCIVDDDDVYKFTVERTIKKNMLAQKILSFSDGEEALNHITENIEENDELPDVILLDINMPIMDGFQFMEEYAKIKPSIGKKIIIYMVSSSVDSVDLERAKKISEISDYIIKPIKPEQLHNLIESLEK